MLRATGVFNDHEALVDRVMDSNDQERERGITILAKAASVAVGRRAHQPGRHPRPRRLRRRGRAGPGPGRRRAAAGRRRRGAAAPDPLRAVEGAGRRPARRRGAQQGRPPGRPAPTRCSTRSTSCSSTSTPTTTTSSSRSSRPSPARAGPWPASACPADDDDLTAAVRGHRRTPSPARPAIPTPRCRPSSPTSTPPTTSAAWPSAGSSRARCARATRSPCSTRRSTRARTRSSASSASLMGFEGISRVDVDERVAGDLFVVAGFPEVEIGDTLADPANPEAAAPPRGRRAGAAHDLRRQHLAAGRQGGHVPHLPPPARAPRPRGARQRVDPPRAETDSPDVIEVAGRGELQLAVLIETMRREGYELQVSRPEVIVTRDRRQAPRAARAGRRRRPRRARRHRHPGAGAPQGQGHRPAPRRHRPHHRHLRGARPAASSASARSCSPPPAAPRCMHQHHAGWIAVGRRAARPQGRRHAGRPHRHDHRLRPRQPAAARRAVRRPGRGGLRGHGRRRERPPRRHERQRGAREAEDQHPHPLRRRGHQAHAAARASRSRRPSSSSPTTSWSRSPRRRSASASGCSRSRTAAAWPADQPPAAAAGRRQAGGELDGVRSTARSRSSSFITTMVRRPPDGRPAPPRRACGSGRAAGRGRRPAADRSRCPTGPAIAEAAGVVVLHGPGEQGAALGPERREPGAAPLLEPLDEAEQHGVLGPGPFVAQPADRVGIERVGRPLEHVEGRLVGLAVLARPGALDRPRAWAARG